MFAASFSNLILPGLHMSTTSVGPQQALYVVSGLILGSLFLWFSERRFAHVDHDDERLSSWGGRTGALVFLAMTIHSIPEGVAVGVGFASDAVHPAPPGPYLPTAILAWRQVGVPLDANAIKHVRQRPSLHVIEDWAH